MKTKNIEILIDGEHSYGLNLQTESENHILIARIHTALTTSIELPVCGNCTDWGGTMPTTLKSICHELNAVTDRDFCCNRHSFDF